MLINEENIVRWAVAKFDDNYLLLFECNSLIHHSYWLLENICYCIFVDLSFDSILCIDIARVR